MLLLPEYFKRFSIRSICKNYDFTVSNVPGPKSPLYFAGSKISELIGFTTPGFFTTYIGIFTYNGSFRLVLSVDKVIDVDPKKLMDIICKEIEIVKKNINLKND